ELHRDARIALARCIPRERPRRPQDDGRDQARARAARERSVAPLAFLRRHSSMEKRSMNTAVYFDRVTSPLGPMLLATDGVALTGAWFDGQRYLPSIDVRWQPRHDLPVLRHARAMLIEYFESRRTHFGIALAPQGTSFQRAVWD